MSDFSFGGNNEQSAPVNPTCVETGCPMPGTIKTPGNAWKCEYHYDCVDGEAEVITRVIKQNKAYIKALRRIGDATDDDLLAYPDRYKLPDIPFDGNWGEYVEKIDAKIQAGINGNQT